MKINTALAAALVLTGSVLQVSALAKEEPRAQLRLIVVDEHNRALPAAEVTVYSTDGNPGRDVTADAKGVATLSLPAGFAEIYARFPGHTPYIEAARLKDGDNVLTVTLPTRLELTEEELAHSAGS